MIAGVRGSAGGSLFGDVGEERDERGAGLSDDGGGDQEPYGSHRPLGSVSRRQDRTESTCTRQEVRRVLLKSSLYVSKDFCLMGEF